MRPAFEELKESRNRLILRFSSGGISETFQEEYTEMVDHYFRRSLQDSRTGQTLFTSKKPFAFVAVGGYGRTELCLHSDIDIFILFEKKIPAQAKGLIEDIFYPLWDLGFDIGHGIRSIKDCLSLSKKDFEILTSMIDARFICGDSQLYLSLMEGLEKKVISKNAITFRRWLEERGQIRMENFGDASHLLEPNLKEGIGGLRDYHHILWLGRSFFNIRNPRDLEDTGKLSHKEYNDLKDRLKLIWSIRNHLHHLSGRKNDRLGFEYQEEIAVRLGFKNQQNLLGVEQFMGQLHACMASIKSLHRFFVNAYLPKADIPGRDLKPEKISTDLYLQRGELYVDSATAILSDPLLLIKIFEQGARLNCCLSLEAMRLVGEFLYLVDDAFRESDIAVQCFLNIMNGEHSVEILDQMLEIGFLETFIPEFGQIKDRVQFDNYHIFPVGRHLLQTVRYLKELPDQKEILLTDIFSDLSNPEPLFLAGLFHDIGKIGKGHARKGVNITRKILDRMGYGKKGTQDILFLVRYHLLWLSPLLH